MPIRAALCAVLLLVAAWPAEVEATTLRYAIVVGNDVGMDEQRGRLADLVFAEREARQLHKKLVDCCHFDRGERTFLMLRPTRAQLFSVVDRLVEQVRRDRLTYGDVNTMFAFFFTGHGLSKRLLLADGALHKAELVDIFKRIDADLNVGMLDACFSGSVGGSDLTAKGIELAENAFGELPAEILNAEGSVWLASSGPNELSYEDRELGGVFTHYFTEALEHAAPDGPAITLERIWAYAQSRTVEHTSRRGRRQTPRKMISALLLDGPLFFSFPVARSAQLVLEEGVRGRFLLSYADGDLSEVIEKSEDAEKTIAVYPGRARLIIARDGRVVARRDLDLTEGASIRLSNVTDDIAAPRLGERVEHLLVKGADVELHATVLNPRSSWFVGTGYEFTAAPRGVVVLRHAARASVEVSSGPWVGELGLGFGRGGERFEAWGYEADALFVSARGGAGLYLGYVQFALLGGIRSGFLSQRFDSGAHRVAPLLMGEVTLRASLLFTDWLGIRASASAGPVVGRGANAAGDWNVASWGGVGVGMIVRAW